MMDTRLIERAEYCTSPDKNSNGWFVDYWNAYTYDGQFLRFGRKYHATEIDADDWKTHRERNYRQYLARKH